MSGAGSTHGPNDRLDGDQHDRDHDDRAQEDHGPATDHHSQWVDADNSPTITDWEGPDGRLVSTGSSTSRRKAQTPRPDEQHTVISSTPPLGAPGSSTAPRAADNMSASLIGETLGHFRLEQFVGGGGMGTVFRALDTMLGRTVAVKVLLASQGGDEETLRRFKNEAQSAARLDHDNIARVYYVGEDRGLHYIVYEFIEGTNIRDLVAERGPLPLEEAISYTLQIAEALAHASDRDVVHRDIKPSNVLVTPQGLARLVDMGLARLYQVHDSNDDLTASGVTLGTFDYISPEQARDPRSADVRSDLYSLGCTLYYMLSARPPFPDGTVLQKLLQHQGDPPPDVRDPRPDLPEEITQILGKMLAKPPGDRFQTPRELIGELLLFAERQGIRPALTHPPLLVVPRAPAAKLLERHLPWFAPVVALLAIVLLLDYLWSPSADSANEFSPLSGNATGAARAQDGDDQQNGRTADDAKAAKSKPDRRAVDSANGDNTNGDNVDSKSKSPSKTTDGSRAAGDDDPFDGDDLPLTADLVADGPSALRRRVDNRGDADASLAPASATAAATVGAASAALAATGRADESAAGLTTAHGAPRDTTFPVRPEDVAGEPVLHVVGEPARGRKAPLAATCAMARSGDIIELQFNGPREIDALALHGKNLTIRAGKGYQPVLVYRPLSVDPSEFPRDMVTLANGRLTLIDVHLELDLHALRTERAEGWSLVAARQAEGLRMSECTLTIRNAPGGTSPFHPDVAFVRVLAAARIGDAEMMIDEETPSPMLELRLENCVARGEATFLWTGTAQPVRLTWENGLLATTERLLLAEGGANEPKHTGHLEVFLRHVTTETRGGLCLTTNTQDRPYQLIVKIDCAQSILIGSAGAADASAGGPLIEQRGIDVAEDARDWIRYRGKENFYVDFDTYWSIEGIDPEDDSRLDFAGWKSFWRKDPWKDELPQGGRVGWKHRPRSDRPVHTYTPDDYALSDEGNPARAPTEDTDDAGAASNMLPKMPPAPSDKAPSDKAFDDKAAADQPPVDKMPVDKMPVEKAPVEKTPTKE